MQSGVLFSNAFTRNRRLAYRQLSRSKYLTDETNLRVACTISKRYQRDYQPYWYALHPAWLEFLEQGAAGVLVLGCMDRNEGYALPLDLIKSKLESLNKTEKDGRYYWHMALQIDGGALFLNMTKTGERLNLEPFAF